MNPELRPPSLSILVVDDEPIVRQSLTDWFRQDGHVVDSAEDASAALRLASRRSHDVAFVDIRMPGIDGLELQARLRADDPGLTIIIMTAYASVETAVEALKSGAYDYVTKPFDPEELSLLVRRVAEQKALQSENLRLKRRLTAVSAPSPIIGDSPAMRRVKDLIAAVSETDSTVLVKGESGTGKELVARAIHARSHRRLAPIVIVNCGALAEGVLESELFGHEKGAFTSADRQKKGLIEVAEGGTLFLDEIGEIDASMQAKLLRILETGQFRRLGGTKDLAANVRVVAATNRSLVEMVDEGAFRADLFYRVNGFNVLVPPLRDRREDVAPLGEHFIRNHSFSRRIEKRLSNATVRKLVSYDWPGNIRELKNVIERAIILSRDKQVIGPEHLAFGSASQRNGAMVTMSFDHNPTLEEVEAEYLALQLKKFSGRRAEVAKTLGISERSIYRMIKRFGLETR
jgi:DNA-binding NtrC family response regulator